MSFKRWFMVMVVALLGLAVGGFVYAQVDDDASTAGDGGAAPDDGVAAPSTTAVAEGADTTVTVDAGAMAPAAAPTSAPPDGTAAPDTAAPTTTAPAATTTAPEGTTSPQVAARSGPSSVAFTETFDTDSGFYDRFDYGFSGYDPQVDPNHIQSWLGDHDTVCAAPATNGDIEVDTMDDLFWWCGPRPDAPASSGHLMTSVNTLGYNIAWFSPAQYFTNVTKVCWDQNMTHMGGRKWINVALVARSDVEHYEDNPENDNPVGHLDLGFTDPDFRDPNGPTTRIHPLPGSGTIGVTNARGWMTLWDEDGMRHDQEITGSYANEDISGRYQQCIVDNGDNSVTMTQGRDTGPLTQVVEGFSFPDGEVRVVFLDDNYDPPKDAEYDPNQNTWHWDNITVEVG